ncbi:unnamed protein product [Effrenium voratum]|uniref:Uncharacterized protein n=1 Tax=Effrenium voratum TaxID=2562239 RepID=A0AA36HRW8_9DINO|nr:unnamed protein product [Effrenium voratum]
MRKGGFAGLRLAVTCFALSRAGSVALCHWVPGRLNPSRATLVLGSLRMFSAPAAATAMAGECDGPTTNADDLEKARQMREEGEVDATAAAAALKAIPDVIIDDGTFKYVLMRVTAKTGESKYLVRGTDGAAYHKDVAMPYMRSYLQQGFEVEVLGGGRILHDAQRGVLKIYGFSYGFPWVKGAGHEITAEVCRGHFQGYQVDWSNEGY